MSFEGRLRKSDWFVASVPLATCHELVKKFHYAGGGSNTATFRHGLFQKKDGFQLEESEVHGIAWWIPPTKAAAIASFSGDWKRVLTLSRLCIKPDVPKNAASFLIMQSVKLIRKTKLWDCLVTYADTMQNHEGTIYRATNWEYMGLTSPEPCFVDGDGKMVARKAGGNTRTRDEMERAGCREIGTFAKHKFRMLIGAKP